MIYVCDSVLTALAGAKKSNKGKKQDERNIKKENEREENS